MDLATLMSQELAQWMRTVIDHDPVLCGRLNPPYAIDFGSIEGARHEHLGYAMLDVPEIEAHQGFAYESIDEYLRFHSVDQSLLAQLHARLWADSEVTTIHSCGLDLSQALIAYRGHPAAVLKRPHSLHGVYPAVSPMLQALVHESSWVKGEDLFFLEDGRARYIIELLPHIRQEGASFKISVKAGVGKPLGQAKLKIAHYIMT